jgi:rhodanese-related sulfurtransferase
MTVSTITSEHVRRMLLLREEIALLDLRREAAYATGHPLFAANMAADRIELEAATRLPRKGVPLVLYGAGDDLVHTGADRLAALGYTNIHALEGGLEAWKRAGYEVFRNSIPTPRLLENWSSSAVTPPRCRRRNSPH